MTHYDFDLAQAIAHTRDLIALARLQGRPDKVRHLTESLNRQRQRHREMVRRCFEDALPLFQSKQ